MSISILFLITARSGSKGVPRKNIREIAGISLVGFKAISARRSRFCTRLMISTDAVEIQENARRYGVESPFTRPAELASDTARSVDVILHAMDWIEENEGRTYDAVMLLEPSAPFARSIDFDGAVEMMESLNANVVVGVRPMEVSSVFVGPLDEEGRLTTIIDKMQSWQSARRQDAPQEVTMNGALYLIRWNFFRQNKSLYCDRERTYGYVMDPAYSIEIDTMNEWHRANFMVERGIVDLAYWKEPNDGN
ncbi:MAG TPA: acylneuraminate cytidylyltransferase family protein [Thermoanaerobaculia bacterium]|nr:acylneuraminate cytidylyltransferase family protein [Thermoanaerobaculia bacterium]